MDYDDDWGGVKTKTDQQKQESKEDSQERKRQEELNRYHADFVKRTQETKSMANRLQFQANKGQTAFQRSILAERVAVLPPGKTVASVDKWSRATVDTSKFRKQKQRQQEQPGLGLLPQGEPVAAGHGKGTKGEQSDMQL